MLFIKEFKEKNSGKFDVKSIMKEGTKAWNIQKDENIITADVSNSLVQYTPKKLKSGFCEARRTSGCSAVKKPKKIS